VKACNICKIPSGDELIFERGNEFTEKFWDLNSRPSKVYSIAQPYSEVV